MLILSLPVFLFCFSALHLTEENHSIHLSLSPTPGGSSGFTLEKQQQQQDKKPQQQQVVASTAGNGTGVATTGILKYDVGYRDGNGMPLAGGQGPGIVANLLGCFKPITGMMGKWGKPQELQSIDGKTGERERKRIIFFASYFVANRDYLQLSCTSTTK